MPEDVKTDEELETEATPELVHDDIVQRLLDYQRQLREGALDEPVAASTATSPLTDEVIDLTAEEEATLEASTEGSVDAVTVSEASFESPAEVAEVIDIATGRAAEADEARASLAGPSEVIGSGTIDAEMSPAEAGPAAETRDVPTDRSGATRALEDRIAGMERSVERLSSRFAELRSSFQDMAIAADERLADIEDILTQLRTP
jgi:hypothetical protein